MKNVVGPVPIRGCELDQQHTLDMYMLCTKMYETAVVFSIFAAGLCTHTQ